MSKPNIILVHGNGGATGNSHWFPQLKHDFEAVGLEVKAQTMPDNILARANKWLPFLHDVLHADENSIIIGHSSGAVAAMRYAEEHKIFGSVLVSASYTDLGDADEKLSGYFDKPWDWDKIKSNQRWIYQYASTDDPYIPIEEAHKIHTELDTDYHEDTNRGHYMTKQFPELVALVKAKLEL